MSRYFSSLAAKICLIIIIIESFVLAGLGYYYIHRFNESVETRVYTNMKIPGRLMNQEALSYDMVQDAKAMTELVGETILEAMVIRRDGLIFYSSAPEKEGKKVDKFFEKELLEKFSTSLGKDLFFDLEMENNRLAVLTPLHRRDKMLGFFFMKADISSANQEKNSIALQFILTSLFCILVTSLIEILLLHYEIIPRLKKSVQCLRKIEKGDLAARINAVKRKDELSELQSGINTMAAQLQEKSDAVESKLQQAQKMEAIGLMAGGVAHDLNNILSGIVGYPELLLLNLPKESSLRRPLEVIQDSGKRAAEVVADLLTVARGAASEKTQSDLNDLIREQLDSPECIKLLSMYAHLKCRLELEAQQACILASKIHVKKCLMNLMTNAAEAMTHKGDLVISTRNQKINNPSGPKNSLAAGDYVVLRVQDGGTGISDEDLAHIFEPFYSKKIMGRSGTGLGLTIVWNTMEEHNGKVFVESNHQGTCFQLYFPLMIPKQMDQAICVIEDDFTGNGELILVVDDEPHLRDLGCRMLESLGYQSHAVSSGEDAIAYLTNNTVDLILIDMLMEPGMNGRQMYEEVIRVHPNQKALVISGYSESADVKATLELGAGGFINKPYSKNQLGSALKGILKN